MIHVLYTHLQHGRQILRQLGYHVLQASRSFVQTFYQHVNPQLACPREMHRHIEISVLLVEQARQITVH